METLLRRHLWIVDLIGIALGAALAGHAVATLMAAALLPRSVEQGSPSARMESQAPVLAIEKSIDGIVGSVAIVRDEEAATTGPYGTGDRLGDATIEAIEDIRVVLGVGRGRREFLELLHRPPRGTAHPRLGLPDKLADGIKQLGTHRYEVRCAAVDGLLAGGLAPPMPRVVPQLRNGESVGLRLSGIGGESPFAAIGLASGDLLLAVNGRSIATPDAALAAYAALRTASQVWLVVERNGERIRLDYVIR